VLGGNDFETSVREDADPGLPQQLSTQAGPESEVAVKKTEETTTSSAALADRLARAQANRSHAAHAAYDRATLAGIGQLGSPFATRVASGLEVPAALGPFESAARRHASASPENSAAVAIDAAVDAALEALFDPDAVQAGDGAQADAAALRAVAETFAGIARLHAHPLRELMFQLSAGRTPRTWAHACRPLLRPLIDGAAQIGLHELRDALQAFDATLAHACDEPSGFIGDATREALKRGYERLRKALPEAFGLAERADNLQLVLLESLLLQVPSLQRRTLAKLYAAGLSSLAQLGQARPEELCAVAGLDRQLARALVEHVQRFESERTPLDPAALRSRVLTQLAALVGRLSQLQVEFERAEQAEDLVRKKAVRRARAAALLELDLAFAEVGDVDLIEELKRCPVRSKIRRVQSYLVQLQGAGS
jgi:hypothetical protein